MATYQLGPQHLGLSRREAAALTKPVTDPLHHSQAIWPLNPIIWLQIPIITPRPEGGNDSILYKPEWPGDPPWIRKQRETFV